MYVVLHAMLISTKLVNVNKLKIEIAKFTKKVLIRAYISDNELQ